MKLMCSATEASPSLCISVSPLAFASYKHPAGFHHPSLPRKQTGQNRLHAIITQYHTHTINIAYYTYLTMALALRQHLWLQIK